MSIEQFVRMVRSSTRAQRAFSRLGEESATRTVREYSEKFADSRGMLSVLYGAELYIAAKPTR